MSNHNQFSLHVIIFSVIGCGNRVHPTWNMHSLMTANRNVSPPSPHGVYTPISYVQLESVFFVCNDLYCDWMW